MSGSRGAVIHESDPAILPDAAFALGAPALLVPGNTGRMLDTRRTPVRVAALQLETGTWICEVLAFEDEGARWALPFEGVTSFQFGRHAASLDAATHEIDRTSLHNGFFLIRLRTGERSITKRLLLGR